ncbi:hypothetical protein [Paeniglutamicibacter sp. NPDC091659]|uniref:hypothetical protein n=1 Tax=Paeniglutamicibacter sp. NPDC091659 TaxID=3364389 RepID=UPI00383028FD
MDPDKYQALLNERDEHDDVAVGMSRYQAQKCAAIIAAGQAGHTAYAEATATVARYLRALALDALTGTTRSSAGSDELWQVLDDLPWPRPGRPATQPD